MSKAFIQEEKEYTPREGHRFPKTAKYLWEIGINPDDVVESSIDENGYENFLYEVGKKNGRKRIYTESGIWVTERWAWLNPQEGQTVLALMKEDRENAASTNAE